MGILQAATSCQAAMLQKHVREVLGGKEEARHVAPLSLQNAHSSPKKPAGTVRR